METAITVGSIVVLILVVLLRASDACPKPPNKMGFLDFVGLVIFRSR
jgi:hypothetical protein